MNSKAIATLLITSLLASCIAEDSDADTDGTGSASSVGSVATGVTAASTATAASSTDGGDASATSENGSGDGSDATSMTTGNTGTNSTDSATSTGADPIPAGRIFWFVSPHGVQQDRYMPIIAKDGSYDLASSQYLSSLAPYADVITLVTGIENVNPSGDLGTGSQWPAATLLTGHAANDDGGFAWTAQGPSIDRVLAGLHDPAGATVPLVLNPVRQGQTALSWVSYEGPDLPTDAIRDPQQLAAAFDLELDPTGINPDSNDGTPERAAFALEAVVEIFARDADTRFGALMMDASEPMFVATWLGHEEPLNNLMHSSPGAVPQQQAITEAWVWQTGLISSFVESLDAVALGEGTLLDYTLIVWTSPYGGPSPINHSAQDLPVLLIGGSALFDGGPALVDALGFDQADLARSVAERAGYPMDDFGDPALAAALIPGIAR